MIISLGSIGFGLMWGWLLVLMMRGKSKRPLVIITLLTATIILAATQFGFGGLPSLFRFLLTTFLALVIHMAWLQSLRQRQ